MIEKVIGAGEADRGKPRPMFWRAFRLTCIYTAIVRTMYILKRFRIVRRTHDSNPTPVPRPDLASGTTQSVMRIRGCFMRYLVLYAHPVGDSFQSGLHRKVLEALADAGHDVDDCDLYAEGFQPLLTEQERRTYHDIGANRSAVSQDIERLLRAEGVVFVFPTWWYGMPAMLKGYIDRVWVPGVAFEVIDGRTRASLQHIVRYAVVTTYGSPWWLNRFVFGDPNRRVFMRCIRHLVSPRARTLWLAQYGLDYIDADTRRRFLEKVARRLRTF
jgi:NAD(P)H dehydrogenase (quinone)